MPILQEAEFAGIRSALSLLLTHTYSRSVVVAGAEDAHGVVTSVPGSAVAGLPCKFALSRLVSGSRVIRSEDGITEVRTPTLTVPYDDPIARGDVVTNILDQTGSVLEAGPFTVSQIDPSAGLGMSLKKSCTLLSGTVRRA